jgi:hypothetical protein
MTGDMSIFVRLAGCFSFANMLKSYWQTRSFPALQPWAGHHCAVFIYGLGFKGWMWCNGPLGKLAS